MTKEKTILKEERRDCAPSDLISRGGQTEEAYHNIRKMMDSNIIHLNTAYRVMIVEDEFPIADAMKIALQGMGYTVTKIVSNGAKAIESAKTDNPDIVLMDIVLQNGIDGIEAAIKIHDLYNIPIIFLTAHADQRLFERAKIANPYGYLIKPCSENDIERTIEMALYKHRLEERLLSLNNELSCMYEQTLVKTKQTEQMLIQQSKLAEIGGMLHLIIHQWVQPLNAINLIAQDIKEAYQFNELNKDYIDNSVQSIYTQINFMMNIIDVFKNFFKPDKKASSFDIYTTIKEVIELFSRQLKSAQIDIELKTNGSMPSFIIQGFPNEFKQVILNLLSNAKDAITKRRQAEALEDNERGRICIDISQIGQYKNERAVIKIIDNGCGLENGIEDKMFNPFVTTKGNAGTGIGLYMSKLIIEGHLGGKISAFKIEGGTMFVIELKAVSSSEK